MVASEFTTRLFRSKWSSTAPADFITKRRVQPVRSTRPPSEYFSRTRNVKLLRRSRSKFSACFGELESLATVVSYPSQILLVPAITLYTLSVPTKMSSTPGMPSLS